jgi:GT2 family glycosyltransferase
MKIAIYCVNYNSYDSLHQYLLSIDKALEAATGPIELKVIVADNTAPARPVRYTPEHFTLNVLITGGNKGYFGAVRLAMQQIKPADFDYSIISNVDVLLDASFFTKLADYQSNELTGWIAPQIYSSLEQRDRNPKILRRYAKRKLQVLKMKFRFPLLNWVYNNTLYKSKKFVSHERGDIYAGHGSFIILTKRFFEADGIIDYPVFLFCEEIYLGEQCRQHGLKVVYEPDIRVTDAEHASTGTFRRSSYCRYNYDALSYILRTYY